uniref:Uncharacterized protein n=1 Tax=Arundo donax TaxID=35708 RepID=A0A0A9FFY3_ARUDO
MIATKRKQSSHVGQSLRYIQWRLQQTGPKSVKTTVH